MSTHQVSYPRAAKKSMTEESARPGTCRSNVGCEAMDEPCTNRIRPSASEGSPAFLFQRKSFTPPSLVAQCSLPVMRSGLLMLTISRIDAGGSLRRDCIGFDDSRPFLDLGLHVRAEFIRGHQHRLGALLLPGILHVAPCEDPVDLRIEEPDNRVRSPHRGHHTHPD